MTSESFDPRFGVIRELLASLTGAGYVTNQTTEANVVYDLDCIVEDLSKLVEQRRAQQDERAEIPPPTNDAESSELSLQAFRCSVDQAADAVFWMKQDGSFAYVNAQACQALGYSQEELLRMHLWDIDPDFTPDRWGARWKKLQENKEGGAERLETFHRRKDGSVFPVDISSTHLWLEDKELHAAVAHDATVRTQTESRLRESEARYRALIESQVDLISRYRPDCTLTFVNNAYCEFYGKTREELVGHNYLEMVAPEFHDLARKETEDLVRNPRPISGEYLNLGAEGEERWIHWVILPIVDDDGQVVELQGVGRDITRLKQTEAALREKYEEDQKFQAQLKALHEISIELTTVDSLDEFYRRTVELGLNKLGFDRIALFRFDAEQNKALGTYGTDLQGNIHPEPHIQFVLEPHGGMWEALQKPERFVFEETGVLHHDQSPVGTGWKLAIALRSGTRILGWLVADNLVRQQPVSQSEIEAIAQYGLYVSAALARKETEAALRESEIFLQKSQSVALIGSYNLDIKTGIWISSPMLDEIFGIDEHLEKRVDSWVSLVHPQHQDEMRQYLSQYVLAERNRFDKEYRILRTSDGQERWVHGLGELEFDAEGNVIRMIGTIQDVTERKQMQQDLLLTQFCVENASIGIMRTGSQAQILSVNQEMCELSGYSAEELRNMHVHDLDPNFPLERWLEHRSRLRRQGADTFETVHQRKDGTTFPVEITTTYVAFEDSEFSFSFIRDITERKQTDRALRLNSFAVEQSADAVYWINECGVIVDINEAACCMTGYARDELIGMPVSGLDAVQTLEEVKTFWKQIKEQGTLTFESQHRTKEGRVFPVEIVVSHIAHEGQEFGCAFARDITQRRLAEEKVKESQALLNESQQFSHTGTWAMDVKSGRLTWTDETFRLFGFQPQEIEPTFDMLVNLVHLDDRSVIKTHLPETLRTRIFNPLTYRVVLPNEEVRWILNSGAVYTDENGEPFRFFGLVQDITERKQAEAALQASEERLRLSIRAGNIGIFDHDHPSNTIYWSTELRALLGWDPDESMSLDVFFKQVHADDQDGVIAAVRQAHDPAGDGDYDIEYRVFDRGGTIHWLSVRSRTFFEGEGSARRPVRTIGAVSDITERKQAEEALSEKEERLQQAVRAGNIGIFDHDHQSNSIYWSPEFRAVYGWDADESVTLEKYFAQVHPEDRERISAAVRRAHDPAGDGDFDVEHRVIDRKGTIRWITARSRTLFEGEGSARRPVRTIGAVSDITERKQAEDTLREKEQRLQQAVRAGNIGIFDHDQIVDVIYWSPEQRKIYGFTPDEPVTLDKYGAHVHPDDSDRIMEAVRRAHDPAGDGSFDVEHRIIDRSGDIHWLTTRSRTFFEGEGSARRPVRTIGAVADVTERMRIEEALRQSEARYRTIVETAQEGIWLIDNQAITTYVNPKMAAMFGYTPGEMLGHSMYDFMDATGRLEAGRNLESRHQGIEEQHQFRFKHKNGTDVWTMMATNPIINDAGQMVAALAMVTDITEQRRQQEALRASEARLREAQAIAHMGNWDWNLSTNELFWSDEVYRMFGLSSQEFSPNIDVSVQKIHPDDQAGVQMAIARALEGQPYVSEHRIIRADGQIRYVQQNGQMVFDSNGKPIRLFGTTQDITERKQAEITLRSSQTRLQLALNAAQAGAWEWNEETDQTIWSEEVYCMMGLVPNSVEPNFENWLHCIHPDDRERARKLVSEHLENFSDLNMEFRVIWPDGSVQWISNIAKTRYDESGRRVGTYGIQMNITERKRAEAETLRLLEILQASLNEIYVFDATTLRFQYVNPSALNNLGYTYDEIQRLSPVDLKPEYTEASFREELVTPLLNHEQGKIVFETIHRRADGSTYPVEAHLQLVAQGDETVFLAVNHDITDRKHAEESLRRLNEELEQRVIERTNELQVANEEIKHFAYIVSHDLRAPLVNLKGFASELRAAVNTVEANCEEVLPHVNQTNRDSLLRALHEDMPEALHFIESSVSHMDVFTKAILKLSRLGRQNLEVAEIQTRSVVENLLTTLAYQIERQNVRIIMGDLPAVKADPVSMEQIFGNILSNAILYLDPERPGEIEISCERNDRETIFHIRDNGRGIAKEDMNRVFVPFRRAGKQDVPGEGMGLAYVQALVRRHGGRIWFDSELGKGTTFTFTISNDLTSDVSHT